MLVLLLSCGRLGFGEESGTSSVQSDASDQSRPTDASGALDARADAVVATGCGPADPCRCEVGQTCDFNCTDDICAVECEAGSDCNIECSPGTECNFVCAPTARCELDCRDGGDNCEGKCNDEAECRLRCTDGECREDECIGDCSMACEVGGACVTGPG